jgi:hypothetical protein
LEAISDDECRDLLAIVQIGRVVLSIDALPAALPVNYWLIDDAIVFRSTPGTKLTAALNHTVVGFEVDEIDPATRSGWSVLVVGTSTVVSDPAEIARLDQAGLRSWAPVPTPHYVKISIQRISGRRLTKSGDQCGPDEGPTPLTRHQRCARRWWRPRRRHVRTRARRRRTGAGGPARRPDRRTIPLRVAPLCRGGQRCGSA